MVVRLVTLQSDVEVGASEAKSRDAGASGMVRRAGPFARFGWNEKGNVGPVDGGIGGLEVRTRRDGSMMKRHDRFHDPCNSSGRLEMADLRLDGANRNVSRTLHFGPQSRQG